MIQKLLIAIVATFCLVSFSFAQTREVFGRVITSNGVPISGVSVSVVGSSNATQTNATGHFNLSVVSGSILNVSYIGFMTQRVTIDNAANYTIVLVPEDRSIAPVVVTALGIKRDKKSLGFASQELKSDELASGTTSTGNIASLLSGKVAGLNVTTTSNFGGSSNLVIRGIKSLGGSTPLIVIDGSPVNNTGTSLGNIDYGNALADINSEDIASVNVLKGAAASALYGERGLNGVIVITTKNGSGKEDGSWGVTFTTAAQIGSIDKSTFPKYQNKYGAGYAPSFYSEAPGVGGYDYVNFTEDASFGPAFDPNKLVYQWDTFDPSSPNYGKASPWVSAENGPITFFNTPVTYTNSLNLQKGDDKRNFSFTYNNMYAEGLVPNSTLSKNTFSVKTNFAITDNLFASVYSTLTLQNTKGRSVTGYSENVTSLFRQWWQTNIDLQDQKRAYFSNRDQGGLYNYGNVTWNRKSSGDQDPAYWNNPYYNAYENYVSDNRFRSFSYAQLAYEINDNLGVTGKLSYDRSGVTIDRRLAVGSLAQAFGISRKDVGSGYERRDILTTETNYDIFLKYKYDLAPDINVSGIVGSNIRRNHFSSIFGSTEGGLVVPNLYALENSRGQALEPVENVWTTQTNSAFATASFDFYKTYYLDATWRIDNSSTLPSSNNTYSYPSITGAAILSELIEKDWLSFWKLRANYAEVGGTADPYLTAYYYRSQGLFDGNRIFLSQTTKPNPVLKPQRAKEFEIGTEFSVFKNRLSFDFAYYKTKTIDQIVTLPVSSASGYMFTNINAGRIDNWGYEVQLKGEPMRTDDFAWNIDVNWGLNRNKVVQLSDGINNYLLNSYQGGVSLNARVGEAWGTLVGSDYVYLNGEKVIDEGTGYYQTKSNQIIGNATPNWIAGIRNSLRYKDFSLSFLLDIRRGGDVFSTDLYYGLATGLYEETAADGIRENGIVWEGVNPNGSRNVTVTANPEDYGNLDGYVRMPAKRFVYDGSYVKLREASVSYNLPERILKKGFIKDAKVSLVGRNLWIIHKNLPYADPEAMVGSGLDSYGWSIGSLPTTRDIGLSVTLKF